MTRNLEPPPHLDDDTRRLWNQTLTQILEAGTIARLDPNSLTAYTAALKNHARATQLLTQTDILINHNGTPTPNPALTIQQDAARTIATFARQFQLTAPNTTNPQVNSQPMPPGQPMPRGRWCDDHHRYDCNGHRKGGTLCHQPAMRETGRCRMHDGRRKHQVLAAELVRNGYIGELKVSAHQAVMGELWRTAWAVQWLGQQVAALEPELLTWGPDREVSRNWGEFPGGEVIRKAGPHALVDLYFRERQHLADLGLKIINAGLAQQLVDVAKDQGMAFARCIEGILKDLELTPEQMERVPDVVPRKLRELTA